MLTMAFVLFGRADEAQGFALNWTCISDCENSQYGKGPQSCLSLGNGDWAGLQTYAALQVTFLRFYVVNTTYK